ncbi:tail fiber assembly protein [Enterobacter asburiae]|nr:tail fiber assembly protein [Enterobacter asburiae]HED2511106.1 tail fiber assembly protein [Enterobacter asburiae]
MYVFSSKNNSFYPRSLQENYEEANSWPTDGVEVSDEEFSEYTGVPPQGKMRGSTPEGMPTWIDIPPRPNSELRKAALALLSNKYQDDIEVLNRAWLAAAVNDGVNETAKKDVVLAQINTRKTQYANDRAAVIAQYP